MEQIQLSDAVTRKQLDSTGVGNITVDIDLKNSYNINNSANRTFDQLKAATNSLVSYEEVRENFIGINEAEAMKTYLDMGKNFIYNVKTPTAKDQAVNKEYVDTTENNIMNAAAMIHATKQELADYLKKDGSEAMTGDLNIDGNQIKNLKTPTENSEASTKKYVDHKAKLFIKKDGSVSMTGDLNLGNKKITGLGQPVSNTDVSTKVYVDHRINNIYI